MCEAKNGSLGRGGAAKHIATGHAKIDPSKPLVPQVGQLRGAYDEWTHQPLPGVPRLFGPDWMEACTKTAWWVIPLVWLPIIGACVYTAVHAFHHTPVAVLWRALCGFALWHALEYALHRFLFHATFTSHVGVTFHFLAHGIHHKYPNDPLRLVMPLVPAALLTAALVSLFRLVLPWSDLVPVAAGTIAGYVQYDCTHYFVHHGVFRGSAWFEPLRESHMQHHYRDHTRGYGITSSFFDFTCGTWNRVQSQFVR